jgi:hypothetical protein
LLTEEEGASADRVDVQVAAENGARVHPVGLLGKPFGVRHAENQKCDSAPPARAKEQPAVGPLPNRIAAKGAAASGSALR